MIMKAKVYDVTGDIELQKMIKERRQYIDDGMYISDYGNYGTSEWLDNLYKNSLITILTGRIIEVTGIGLKNDFPVFKIEVDGVTYEYECKGLQKYYVVGELLRLFVVRKKDIFEVDDSGFQLLKVEAL